MNELIRTSFTGGNLYEEVVDGKTIQVIQDNNGDVRWPPLKAKIDSGEVVPVDVEVSEKYIALKADYDARTLIELSNS